VRRLIASVQTTLDGRFEGANGVGDLDWLMPHVEDSLADNQAMLEAVDTIVLGRITYEGFSQFWPLQTGPFADLMNRPTKLVLSRGGTLDAVSWGAYDNARLVDRDAEAHIRELKAQEGRDMVITASGTLIASFLGQGLIDELRLIVVPVVLGAGKRLFDGVAGRVPLELRETARYPKGSIRLVYDVGG
jgi:dihydrofolate reductase